MTNQIDGFRELSAQLSRMGSAVGGKTLRRAAMQATLPALQRARSAAPVGNPPYESGDPYPKRTYKGRLVTPGFLQRNIRRQSKLSPDKRTVKVRIGPTSEAFYGTQFIELGTSSIPKRPWLEPSFRQSLPDVNSRFRTRLKMLIDKAAR